MSQDVKIFDLEVWGSKNIQIEAFSIQGHGPRMLKSSIWRFGNPKTSKSKLLASRGMAPGCENLRFEGLGIQKHPNRSFYHPGAWPQDVKTFEFEVLGIKNFDFEGFNILVPSVRLAGCCKLRFGMAPRFGGLGFQKHPNRRF